MKIDAHRHFWLYRPQEYGWIDETMRVLRRDFMPTDMRDDRQVIAVQARQDLRENALLLSLAEMDSRLVGVVGWVDLQAKDVSEQLAKFSSLCGIRHILQSEQRDDFMLRPAFQRGLRAVTKADMAYDLLIHPRHLPIACQLVAAHPNQRFILDHLAKPFIASGDIEPWRTDLTALSRFPNVWCKLSGLVTEADWKTWTPADLKPYLDAALEAFGPHRLMFGSDWPVCLVAATYERVVETIETWASPLSASERDMIFGGSARAAYAL